MISIGQLVILAKGSFGDTFSLSKNHEVLCVELVITLSALKNLNGYTYDEIHRLSASLKELTRDSPF